MRCFPQTWSHWLRMIPLSLGCVAIWMVMPAGVTFTQDPTDATSQQPSAGLRVDLGGTTEPPLDTASEDPGARSSSVSAATTDDEEAIGRNAFKLAGPDKAQDDLFDAESGLGQDSDEQQNKRQEQPEANRLRKRFRELYSAQFDLRQQRQLEKIERQIHKLQALKVKIHERQQHKEAIVDARVRKARAAEGLGSVSLNFRPVDGAAYRFMQKRGKTLDDPTAAVWIARPPHVDHPRTSQPVPSQTGPRSGGFGFDMDMQRGAFNFDGQVRHDGATDQDPNTAIANTAIAELKHQLRLLQHDLEESKLKHDWYKRQMKSADLDAQERSRIELEMRLAVLQAERIMTERSELQRRLKQYQEALDGRR